jgi:hypothetical protein
MEAGSAVSAGGAGGGQAGSKKTFEAIVVINAHKITS